MLAVLVEIPLMLALSWGFVRLARWRRRSELFRWWAWISLPVLWAGYIFWKVLDGSAIYPVIMAALMALSGFAALADELYLMRQIEKAAEERRAMVRRRDELRALFGFKPALPADGHDDDKAPPTRSKAP